MPLEVMVLWSHLCDTAVLPWVVEQPQVSAPSGTPQTAWSLTLQFLRMDYRPLGIQLLGSQLQNLVEEDTSTI